MARFLKFKFLITLKLNFDGGQLKNNNFVYFKKLKSHSKIVKFAVKKILSICAGKFEDENFEHLY